MIPVNKTFLPPINEYKAILQRAWDKQWITNHGELVQELGVALKQYLGVPNITLTANGTLPLQIAIKALGLQGEIITTPFSYVATTSAIVWEGCTPAFVDIHPEHLTIDETKIEAAITPRTTAILATHVFGNPCDVELIEAIAQRHGLKVIFDAAHAFGVTYKGQPLMNFGDVSTCSFHATKIFHTGEGGAMICRDPELHERLFWHHNFGHDGPYAFHGLGINAKMSELHAAMGLAMLPYIGRILSEREGLATLYRQLLEGLPMQLLKIREHTEWNFQHFPVIFNTTRQLDQVMAALQQEDIHSRRYFYPALHALPYVQQVDMPVAGSVAERILCLPLYAGLKEDEVRQVSEIIRCHL
jgi:dTDP-4-amino-4,6-dideoxygalactose transaminase